MEIYIIIILIIFIIFLNYLDELKIISNIKSYKHDKINNISIFDNIFILYTNPVLLKLYKNIFLSVKKINKYDYKSYFTYLENNKISMSDRLILDWFNINYGIIKFAQDTLKKINNNAENLYSNIDSLYNYYLFIEKINNNIKISENKKFIKNKKNIYLIKLLKIEELLQKLFKKYLLNNKLNKNITEIINKEKNINLINFKINVKHNKLNKLNKLNNNILYNYFV